MKMIQQNQQVAFEEIVPADCVNRLYPNLNALSNFTISLIFSLIFCTYILNSLLKPIQDGHFRGCSRIGEGAGAKRSTLPKICDINPTVMKLGTVIPYLKKIQKIYESRGTSPADISIFPLGISKPFYTKKYGYQLHFST